MVAFTGWSPGSQGQNLAAVNFQQATNFANQQQDLRNKAVLDAALRQSLGNLSPTATPAETYRAVEAPLAASPGGGQSLLSMRMAPIEAAAKLAPQMELAKVKAEGDLATAQERTRGQTEAAAIRARAAANTAGQSHADRVETNIATLIHGGNVDAAQALAERNGVTLPPAFWTRAKSDAGMRSLIGLYKGDSKGLSAAISAYDANGGDVQAAVMKAGAPKATADGHTSSDLQTLDWMLQPDPTTGKPLAANRGQAVQLLRDMRSGRAKTQGYAVQAANAFLQANPGYFLSFQTPEAKRGAYNALVADFDANLRGHDTNETPDLEPPPSLLPPEAAAPDAAAAQAQAAIEQSKASIAAAPPAAPPVQTPTTAAAPGGTTPLPAGVTPEMMVQRGRAAIAQGKDPAAVAKLLQQYGINGGL